MANEPRFIERPPACRHNCWNPVNRTNRRNRYNLSRHSACAGSLAREAGERVLAVGALRTECAKVAYYVEFNRSFPVSPIVSSLEIISARLPWLSNRVSRTLLDGVEGDSAIRVSSRFANCINEVLAIWISVPKFLWFAVRNPVGSCLLSRRPVSAVLRRPARPTMRVMQSAVRRFSFGFCERYQW